MNDTAPIQFQHGIPPIPSLIAVLVCAAVMVTLYQVLFPRPARWYVVALALVLGGALTGVLTLILTPTGQRLMEIHDLWSALRIVVLTVGLPEEAVKGLAALITIVAFRRVMTPAMAFQAALFAALGFAIVENALYAKAFEGASLVIALGRGIIASFIHSLMMMIQGTFLARFVATGWRRVHLVVIGWLLAAAAHAGFDWGMLKPLVVYLTQGGDPMAMQAAIVESFPVLIIGLPAPFVIGLVLFRRALRHAGKADAQSEAPGYAARIARWKKAGNIVLVLGAVGFVAALAVAAYVAAKGGLPAPAATTPPDLAGEMKGSALVTAAIVASPAAIILGLLLRWKR
jgi:RsiW-degrading membrane proteinase PrsW (M82 family)